MKKLILLITFLPLFIITTYADVKFEIFYTDEPDTGIHLYPEAKKSLEEAAATVGSWLDHDATVNIEVKSENAADKAAHTANTTSEFFAPGIYHSNAAKKILFNEKNEHNKYDFSLVINSRCFHQFDFGDEVTPEKIDFKSVIMHEITHGLGFESQILKVGGINTQFKNNPTLVEAWHNIYLYCLNPNEENKYKDAMESLIQQGISMDKFISNYDLIVNGGDQFTFFDTLLYDSELNPLIDTKTFQLKRPDLFESEDKNSKESVKIVFQYNGKKVSLNMNKMDLSHLKNTVNNHLMNSSDTGGPGPRRWSNVERAIMETLGYKLKPAQKFKWIYQKVGDEEIKMQQEL